MKPRPRILVLLASLLRAPTLALVLAHVVMPGLVAQEPLGLPPIERLIPNVPGGGSESVAVVHASDGLIYSLTAEEVMSFDGARWKLYELPGARTWSSLADRPGGGVFLGGDEEIGALIPGPDSVLRFHSLLEAFPDKRRTINVVTNLLYREGQLYFTDNGQAGRIVLSEEGNRGLQMELLGVVAGRGFKTDAHYLVAASKTGEPYVVVNGKGICRWTQKGAELIPGGEHFAKKAILALEEVTGRLLVVDHSKGMHWLEQGKVQPFVIQNRDELKFHVQTGFCRIPGIGYAIATNSRGLLICDQQGQLIWHLDRELGLGTDNLYAAPAPDRQGGLWVPLESGLLRIGLRSPLQIFDERVGLDGEIQDACWHKGHWYVATSKGIYVYKAPTSVGRPGRFERIENWVLQIRKMESDGEDLLASTLYGLMRVTITDGDPQPLRLNTISHSVFMQSQDGMRLWAGGQHAGLEEFSRESGKWKQTRIILEEKWTPHAFVESDDGKIYTLVHIHSEEGRIQVLEISGPKPIRMWSSVRKTPQSLRDLHLYSRHGKVRLRTTQALFEFKGTSSVISGVSESLPGGHEPPADLLEPLAQGADRLWYRSRDQRYACMKQQDDLCWARWNPFRGIPGGQPTWFDVSADGRRAWMGNREGRIAYYREPEPGQKAIAIRPMIQDLVFLDGSNQFLGHAYSVPTLPSLPLARSPLRIRYSLPAFGGTYHRVYQTRMLGLEKEWTPWRRAPFREFSSLPTGEFRFEVRALDVHGRMSATEGVDIVILKPWYATAWAILLYILLGGLLIWGLVKARIRLAEKRIRRLEEEIRQRELAERAKAGLEEQLRQAQRLESLGRMAGGVAHDFNNLLTAILGHAELVKADAIPGRILDRKTIASIDEIMKSGRRAADLTHRLLAFSRKQVLHPRVIEINEILEGLKLMLSRLLRDDIEMVMQIDPDAGKVRVDPGQIEQVILNLVLNACDAMPEGGKLEVWTKADLERREDAPFGSVTLSVRDNGTGIESGILEEIFEPFFTTKPVGQGTGLGLSSALGIVEQSGGTLKVSSQLGEGTLFEIEFARLEAGVLLPTPTKEIAPVGSGERILLVDDDEAVRSIAKILLSSKGYEILEASSGQDALNLFKTQDHWHLLITDLIMPGMNGRELARRLRGQEPELPVLYLSGYSTDQDLSPELAEGRSAFLQKPFHSKSLLAAVRELLDRVPSPSE